MKDLRRLAANGVEAHSALDSVLAPMVLDCLEAMRPADDAGGDYLVWRTMQVVGAIEGGSWARLTAVESDVALCLSSLLASPRRWDGSAWDQRMARALVPYLSALGLAL